MINYINGESGLCGKISNTDLDRAVGWSIRQGRGLRFSCKDQTVEVSTLSITWLSAFAHYWRMNYIDYKHKLHNNKKRRKNN